MPRQIDQSQDILLQLGGQSMLIQNVNKIEILFYDEIRFKKRKQQR